MDSLKSLAHVVGSVGNAISSSVSKQIDKVSSFVKGDQNIDKRKSASEIEKGETQEASKTEMGGNEKKELNSEQVFNKIFKGMNGVAEKDLRSKESVRISGQPTVHGEIDFKLEKSGEKLLFSDLVNAKKYEISNDDGEIRVKSYEVVKGSPTHYTNETDEGKINELLNKIDGLNDIYIKNHKPIN